MIVKQFRVGGDRNFGYLAGDMDSKLAAVIDPAYSHNRFSTMPRRMFLILSIFFVHITTTIIPMEMAILVIKSKNRFYYMAKGSC